MTLRWKFDKFIYVKLGSSSHLPHIHIHNRNVYDVKSVGKALKQQGK